MKREPIRIPCEGSGGYSTYCQMCGRVFPSASGIIPRHDRDDILAMLKRGDFDGPAT